MLTPAHRQMHQSRDFLLSIVTLQERRRSSEGTVKQSTVTHFHCGKYSRTLQMTFWHVLDMEANRKCCL